MAGRNDGGCAGANAGGGCNARRSWRQTALQFKNRTLRPPAVFNLDVLDDALAAAAAARGPPPPPPPPMPPRGAAFLEIHGPAATGKSVLLEAAVARTVLPEWLDAAAADVVPPAPSRAHEGRPPQGEHHPAKRRRPQEQEQEPEQRPPPAEGRRRPEDREPARSPRAVRAGGRGKRALVIDLSPRGFDLERMERQCAARLYAALSRAAGGEAPPPPGWEGALQAAVDAAARRVHVLRADTAEALLARLPRLPALLADLPPPAVGLLAVDEPGAFYWEDRARDDARVVGETGGSAAAAHGPGSALRVPAAAAALGRALASAADELGAVVLAATGSVWDAPGRPPRPAAAAAAERAGRDRPQDPPDRDEFYYKDHMPPVGWQDLVTHRIVTGRPPPRNRLARPPDESELAAAHPGRLAGSGKCAFWVATCGGRDVDADWSSRIAAARRDRGAGRWFEFDVAEYGVALGS